MNEQTVEELREKLAKLDELTLLELLDVTSEELVLYLTDQIEWKYDQLIEYFEEEQEGE